MTPFVTPYARAIILLSVEGNFHFDSFYLKNVFRRIQVEITLETHHITVMIICVEINTNKNRTQTIPVRYSTNIINGNLTYLIKTS